MEIDATKKIIRSESDEFARQICESSEKIQGYAKSHFREGMVSKRSFYRFYSENSDPFKL